MEQEKVQNGQGHHLQISELPCRTVSFQWLKRTQRALTTKNGNYRKANILSIYKITMYHHSCHSLEWARAVERPPHGMATCLGCCLKRNTSSRKIANNNNTPLTECLLCVRHIILSAYQTFYISSHHSPFREVTMNPILETEM